ncbi:NAD(P)-dependent oxidoreductase [Pendulispora brunnea]|uniref:NAD(P)-dependent oxidoreductase n=1 Tax=Pendulispora brunnea TaxID=2905690 RepID=A0ABZ2KM64_9BACT
MTLPAILLLGGSGFVGRALLREFARVPEGAVRVRALLRRMDAVPDHPFLEKVSGDIEHPPADLEPTQPYVLVHFAVKQMDKDGSGYLGTNVHATAALLERLGPRLRGIIYASSMSVYGQGEQDGIDESAPPSPDTALARSRRLAEEHIEAYARRARVPSVLLRPRFVIGEGDRFVMPAFAQLAAKNIQVGSGSQRYSVIDVDDYARIIVRLTEHLAQAHQEGNPFHVPLHVGYARPVTFAQITDALRDQAVRRGLRWRIPVSPRALRLLRRVPSPRATQMATRLELLGLSHWGNTTALETRVGNDIVGKDPSSVLLRAACFVR